MKNAFMGTIFTIGFVLSYFICDANKVSTANMICIIMPFIFGFMSNLWVLCFEDSKKYTIAKKVTVVKRKCSKNDDCMPMMKVS